MATFRARARMLDMLGRQQIAGIPTAISELFKNAHDAYADRVEVDFFRTEGIFLLRDDGLGMTRDDFERRWLTVGTESKLGAGVGLALPYVDPDKPVRPILGEKGIGRLAIAVIGPQVLIMTRAIRPDGLHDLVAAFIHWGLFECPGIDLDQIEIPIRTFNGGMIPGRSDIREMVESVRSNIERLCNLIDKETTRRFEKELGMFDLNPEEFDGCLDGPSLGKLGHGTHFLIRPASDNLVADIDGSRDDDAAPPLIKNLIGFTNTMTPGHISPPIKTSFRDHRTLETYEDLIALHGFFTPEEFQNADHHVAGEFDKYGQFKGTVSVYGEEYTEHVVPWPEARGRPIDCGPFAIQFGYVQGAARESTIPTDDYVLITRKLNRIGGLYVYRDGIRVLPYGDADFDWLDIERNRTKGAAYYFFSYRRLFGLIDITHTDNSNLSEKAGREGFRENRAYRQFRNILKNFFVQIAADFFREGGSRSESYNRRKSELDRIERARREQEKRARAKRFAFGAALDRFFSKVEGGEPSLEVAALLNSLAQALDAATRMENEEAVVTFNDAETTARRALEKVRASYRVPKPLGVGLTKQLRREWDAYLNDTELLEAEVFSPALNQLERIVNAAADRSSLALDRCRRLEHALSNVVDEARRMVDIERIETRKSLADLSRRVSSLIQSSSTEVLASARESLSQFARLDFTANDSVKSASEYNMLLSRVTTIAEHERDMLARMRAQLESVDWPGPAESDAVSSVDMVEALEEEVLALRERAEADLELTQLGMAIDVINHEFGDTVLGIRDNLRRLRVWADVNKDLEDLYQSLRSGFEHLDGYLALFTPLQRRLYRAPIEFGGVDIVQYLRSLFRKRLAEEDVALEVTAAFEKKRLVGYPSTFYPVFVNLVDNALYWLRDTRPPRIIRLDVDADALVVSDTGPGVAKRDCDAVFELGFTRKPGGRGLGLYISRDVMSKAGYRLLLDANAGKGGGNL